MRAKRAIGEDALAPPIQRNLDIGLAEIVADEQQWASPFVGERVSETISKNQSSRMAPLSPNLVGFHNAPGVLEGHGLDFEVEPIDQCRHLESEFARPGDD